METHEATATSTDPPATGRFRRLHSYPFVRSISTDNYATANDVFPVRVPLEKVEFGSWRYTATELEDIELLYELESSHLLVKVDVSGTNGAIPAMFRVRTVSAADLSLISIVPGSLETMVARLVLETEDTISYKTTVPEVLLSEPSTDSSQEENEENVLDCRIIKMTASVHESGHLRDILLFLKSEYTADIEVEPDSVFVNPQRKKPAKPSQDSTTSPNAQFTFLEGLPYWVLFIPWWLYSKKFRVLLQWMIVVYSLFSVIWAMWQLYKHVNVIHVVVEPIILVLKHYLAGVMEAFDLLFALFTHWWQTILSPLNILRGLISAPLLTILFQLRTVFGPMISAVFQIFNNSALKSLFVVLVQISRFAGGTVLVILKVLLQPLNLIWRGILNSRVAVTSLDFHRMRLSWIFSLVMNSLRSIGRGLLYLAGYTRKEHKKRKALHNVSKSAISPVASVTPSRKHSIRQQKMPIYYSSPLSKQN